MRSAAILVNPIAGRGAGLAAAELAATRLGAAGWAAEILPTHERGQGAALAAQHGRAYDLLVAVGGDGTVREVAEGLLAGEHTTPLGFVPLGNANVVARELGIPLDHERAVALLTEGAPRALDVCFAGTRLVLAMVGLGYDGRVTRGVDRARANGLLKHWYRLHADSLYGLIGATSLVEIAPPRMRLTVDGERLEPRFCNLVVANMECYAKGWAMAPGASPSDGLLDYAARRNAGPHAAAWALFCAARRKCVGSTSYGRARSILVEAERPVPWQADGDPMGATTRLMLEVRPAALSIVVP